jgi:RNA polymerase sigma-70 factor (ECF subfamily)
MLYLPEESKDVVQDVFFKIWEKRQELQITSVRAYLHQATRNRVLNAIRSMKTDDQFYERLAAVTMDMLTENNTLLRENETLINQLIETLPDDCRETFRLSRKENLSYKEIAAKQQISEKTVEKRISKALKHFRANSHLLGIYLFHVIQSWLHS